MSVVARVLLAGLIVSVVMLRSNVVQAADAPASNRLFELRTYVANEGKMDDLHKRFREHTNGLFVKHGMTLIAYWTPLDGPDAANTLIYVLAYPDREARDKSWKEFQADPEWQAAYKKSHENGPLVKNVVTRFMTPTDYSPLK
jgi:hypothetical protein